MQGSRMDFERAKSIGDQGERAVAAELDRLASQYGAVVIHDVLLEVGPMTAQIDHIVVDRYGVLIVESKVRGDALIKGNDRERQWTACYRNGKTASFQNPLRQNEEHENALRQALERGGREIDPDYVKSAVVFMGADLTQLKLDSLSRARIVDVADVPELMKRRHEFALNPGAMDGPGIADTAQMILRLDCSADPAVLKRHADYRQGRGRARAGAYRRTPASRRSQHRPARAHARASAVGADGNGRAASPNLLRGLLAAALVIPILSCVVLCSMSQAIKSLSGVSPTAGPGSSAGAEVTVEQALAVLSDAAPEKAAALVNRSQPLVTPEERGTTFTWEYIISNEGIAQVGVVSITLDAAGNLVGVY